ncbi:MAG TPA: hypothetical protein VKA34_22715, partial [Balneolales bacterium]|nr:hypothetical protein [Balneolales bacterium]
MRDIGLQMKSLHANVRKIIIILLSVTGYLFVNTGCLRAQQFYGSGQEINEAYQYYRKGNYQQAITILQNTLASDS